MKPLCWLGLFSYVLGETSSGSVVVVHGEQGCGKTTLLARTAQCCHSWLPDCAVLVRAANISPQSSTLEQLLRTITLQCSIVSTGEQVWLKHVSTTKTLPRLLTNWLNNFDYLKRKEQAAVGFIYLRLYLEISKNYLTLSTQNKLILL